MSDIPPVDTPLGDLVVDEVFIDYDGPKLFTCIDEYGSVYLAVFADEDDDFEIYVYVNISPTQLDTLRTGQVTFREAFVNSLDGNVWVVRRSLNTTEGAAEQVSPEAIPVDWLPSEDARLVVEAPSVPAAQGGRNGTIAGLSGTFGAPDSLQIKLSAAGGRTQTPQHVSVSIRIGGAEAIPFDSSADDVDECSAEIDQILHDLARAWPFIEWEESSPWGVHVKSLAELDALAQNDEAVVSSDLRREREERNREFVQRHNLARILRGQAASLLAFRKGRHFNLLSAHESWTVPAAELLDLLQKLGDALANGLRSSGSAESAAAVDAWRKKRSLRTLRIAEIATGISAAELRLVEQALGDGSVWISPDDPASNELYAAARMSAGLSADEIAEVIDAVSSTPKATTQELDTLSREAARVVVDDATHDFQTGYDLAKWYRQHLGVTSTEAIDPEQRLRSLGVEVRAAALSRVIDAVAVWGPRHGPCVIVNSKGQNSRSPGGHRATLAHELGHMLLDRTDSLPLAEVLGGRTDESVEARARAFAVELLLPRETAAVAYAASPESPEGVVESLVDDYGVSREVAAWQIRNSAVRLTTRGRSVLRSYVRNPGSF